MAVQSISELISYPIKSGKGMRIAKSNVTFLGLQYDRHWAVFDKEGKALTARTHPALLDLHCRADSEGITITYSGTEVGLLTWPSLSNGNEDVHVHSYRAFGNKVSDELDKWISTLLGTSCRLLSVNSKRQRPVLPKHGGTEGDSVGFNDQAPILIISEASLNDLNRRIGEEFHMDRFRPNIVVSGCKAYEEDSWKIIQVGEVRLRIIQQCERCVFTTIDPVTKEKHASAEPLTTLAKYRIGPRGGLVFGVHAVPLNEGVIMAGDLINVLSVVERPVSVKA